jgi:NTP pyrophosphatase (non-canonical NTP hydrolase)
MARSLEEMAADVQRVSDIYAARYNVRRDDDWHALKLQEELGELIAEFLRATGRGREKPCAETHSAMADEAADLFAHLLLFCAQNKIDLEAALARKWFRYLDHP